MRPKTAQRIQNEIFKRMPAEKKIRLFFKINGKVLRIAKKKMESRYPQFDPISLTKKLHEHFSSKREFYNNLFNQFLKENLKKYRISFENF